MNVSNVPRSADRSGLVAAFVLGASSGLYVGVGGQLYLAEVALLCIAPYCIGRRQDAQMSRWFSALGVLWAVGAGLSFLWSGGPGKALVTEMTGICMLLVTVWVLLFLLTSHAKFTAVTLGVAFGYLVSVKLQPSEFFGTSPWKFGYGPPVTLLLVFLASRSKSPVIRLTILGAAAAANLFGDYRSFALVLSALAVADIFRLLLRRRLAAGRSGGQLVVAMVVALGLVGTGISSLYTSLALSGRLGAAAQVRLEQQGGGSPVLMILGGRNEIFVSLPAALERPIQGYGPVTVVSRDVLQTAHDQLINVGLYNIAEAQTYSTTIAAHSVIMGAWLSAGIVGLIFWALGGAFLIRAIPGIARLGSQWLLPGFLVLWTLWNLLYSPFGGTTRFLTALAIAWSMKVVSDRRSPELPNVSPSARSQLVLERTAP